jgi:hypothetical protein
MSRIQIADLQVNGTELFQGTESFLTVVVVRKKLLERAAVAVRLANLLLTNLLVRVLVAVVVDRLLLRCHPLLVLHHNI